jgi:hypothetical protein
MSCMDLYLGGCKPGDFSHSSAVSACLALSSKRSAFALISSTRSANRSSNEAVCFTRRRRTTGAPALLGNNAPWETKFQNQVPFTPADFYSTRRRVRRLFIRSRAGTTSSLSRTAMSRCTDAWRPVGLARYSLRGRAWHPPSLAIQSLDQCCSWYASN